MGKNNITLKYRVEQLEGYYFGLDKKMDLILQNHLPHINEELVKINTRMFVITGVNVGAIIIALVLARYL